MMRLALLLVVLFPALALAQGKEKDEDKVSNDQPDRPLQMPPATTEVKEAIDDFDRFSRRGAWERALKSLYTISEDQAQRFVDGEKGFIIPVGRKRRLVLAALPAAGRAAYRLFYDSEAKKLFDEATGANELKTLERLYSAYFSTSIGDNAADRLGDLYFELGRFDRAADCWLDVLRERTDTDLSPALLSVKAALALQGRAPSVGARASSNGRCATIRGRQGHPRRADGRRAGPARPAAQGPRAGDRQRALSSRFERSGPDAAQTRSNRSGRCGSVKRSKRG